MKTERYIQIEKEITKDKKINGTVKHDDSLQETQNKKDTHKYNST